MTVPYSPEAANEQIGVPLVPSPQYARAYSTPLEVFSFSPDWPIGAVDTYPDPDVVGDPYAYQAQQWEFPPELFNIEGPGHAAYMDATAPTDLGAVPNLVAPLPAMANTPGYGLGG